jgi:phytoene dehydrogenase-like protein
MGFSIAGPFERLRALTRLPMLIKYSRITLEQFAQRFTDPFLRRAFPTLIYDWPGASMVFFLGFLGRLSIGDLGWPRGGAIAFARAIEQRFVELGGEVRYGARVQSIVVENDCAVGVRLDDGSEQRAKVVVSNAYGHDTIYKMLGGAYTSPAIRSFYAAPEDRVEMGVHVSLGLARALPAEPHAIVLMLDRPVRIAGEMRHRLYVEPFGFDPSLAPPGKSVLKVMIGTSYSYWQGLHGTPDAYAQEKHRIAETVITALETLYPGLRQQIEVVDVATPMTTLRFTGNGQPYHFPETALVRAMFTGWRLSQTLPGLRNFFMVGQWAGVGGLPSVAAMGRDVARAICRGDRRVFRTDAAGPAARGGTAAESRTQHLPAA